MAFQARLWHFPYLLPLTTALDILRTLTTLITTTHWEMIPSLPPPTPRHSQTMMKGFMEVNLDFTPNRHHLAQKTAKLNSFKVGILDRRNGAESRGRGARGS